MGALPVNRVARRRAGNPLFSGKTPDGLRLARDGDAARIMEQVLAWIDRAARPVLVQLPSTEYDRLQRAWSLPER